MIPSVRSAGAVTLKMHSCTYATGATCDLKKIYILGKSLREADLRPNWTAITRAQMGESMLQEIGEEMPAALCGWCDGAIDCGIHLSYCITWQRVSAQLHIDTPRAYRRAHVAQPASEM